MTEKTRTILILIVTLIVLAIVRFVPSPKHVPEEYTVPPDPEDIYGTY